MKKRELVTGLLIVLLIISTLVLYTLIIRSPIVVEKQGIMDTANEVKTVNAVCPEGRQAISGGCTYDSAAIGLNSFGLDLENNAWFCNYQLNKIGSHNYGVSVVCQ